MEIKLNKNVHGKKGFRKVNDIEFRELASDAKKFSLEKFFKLYNRMFFNIPKEGEESHTSIMERSRDYVRNYVDPLQYKVDKLTDYIADLEQRLGEMEQQHPFFPNGKLLMNPSYEHGEENGEPQAYVMENGLARAIKYWGEHRILRATLGYDERFGGEHEGTGWKGYVPLKQSTLDALPLGPPINSSEDLMSTEWRQPQQFRNWRDLKNSIEKTALTAAQKEILMDILESKTVNLAAEDDPNRIAHLDLDEFEQYVIDRFGVAMLPPVAMNLVKWAQTACMRGEGNEYFQYIRMKAVENSRTVFRQAIHEGEYLYRNGDLDLGSATDITSALQIGKLINKENAVSRLDGDMGRGTDTDQDPNVDNNPRTSNTVSTTSGARNGGGGGY